MEQNHQLGLILEDLVSRFHELLKLGALKGWHVNLIVLMKGSWLWVVASLDHRREFEEQD